MGLIDRAFGADKNSLMFAGLAFHWRAVASHHEHSLKELELDDNQREIFSEIQKRSLEVAELANSSVKGFGISSPDIPRFLDQLETLTKLQNRIEIVTDKKHWLPEAIVFTKMILNGEKRYFKNNQYWFSDK